MGKTFKGKDKAKKKAQDAKRKIIRKCKGACVLAFLLLLCGCATSENTPAERAQTMHFEVTLRDQSSLTINGGRESLEFGTQTQANETSGTETFAPQNTQTPTTDVKPDIDVNYAQGGSAGSGASASGGGILDTLASSSLSRLVRALKGREATTLSLTRKDGTTADVECRDGSCTVGGRTYTAADCENCTPPKDL